MPLYDYWREPGVAYLVMRLLRGGSLHALLQQGPPLEQGAAIVSQIGAALQAAHRAGVVHHDLKPANVLLDEEGKAYPADFGIAKDVHRSAELSFAGAFVGSPAYASPEQIRAERVSPQTDIYALGMLLYELLTGRRPFEGPTPASYLEQHLKRQLPRWRRAGPTCRPDLPASLDATIRRATAKLPTARFASVAALLAEVRDVLRAGHAPAPTLPTAAPLTAVLDLSEANNPYQGLRPFEEGSAAGLSVSPIDWRYRVTARRRHGVPAIHERLSRSSVGALPPGVAIVSSQPAALKRLCGTATSSAQYPDGWRVPSFSVQWSAADSTMSSLVMQASLCDCNAGAEQRGTGG